MIGAAVALWMADSIVGLSSLVGIMMLVGIVVTNAIVLIDRVQNNRRVRGMGVYDALMEGGRTRIRPILMTAIAAILALVPLAVGLSEGAIIASDLAIVVIGGLTTSTLLTLVVVPVIYSLLDRFDRRNRRLDEQQGQPADEDGSDDDVNAEVEPVQEVETSVPGTTPADPEAGEMPENDAPVSTE